MPRAKNSVETVQITVSTTKQVRQYLEVLTGSGLYGKNVAETVNMLITTQIRDLMRTGEIDKLPPFEEEEE